MTNNTVNIIIGPTASGKTALAVERALARDQNNERALAGAKKSERVLARDQNSARCLENGNAVIINADAMQCYAALPILTAQPTLNEQRGVPHHLFGVLEATETLNATQWAKRALTHIHDALNQGKTPTLVGGTGFYIKALTHGISPIPDIAPHYRENLIAELNEIGLPALYARLQTQDPAIATRLKAGDTQRILRALEVYAATNTPLSHWQSLPPVRLHENLNFHITALNPAKEILNSKITARLHVMLNAGVLTEVEKLSARIDANEVPENAAITIAHGFKYFRAHIKNQMSLEDAIAQTALETRQYTKRQRTWLRGQITAHETIG